MALNRRRGCSVRLKGLRRSSKGLIEGACQGDGRRGQHSPRKLVLFHLRGSERKKLVSGIRAGISLSYLRSLGGNVFALKLSASMS